MYICMINDNDNDIPTHIRMYEGEAWFATIHLETLARDRYPSGH